MKKLFLIFASLLVITSASSAQDTTRVPTGVELRGTYNVSKRPLVAVRRATGAGVTQQVTDIIQRDLQLSDRFEMGVVPERLATGAVDYRAWNSLNVWYLAVPTLTISGQGYQLRIDLHDIVYANIKGSFTQTLPAESSPNFRLAVHAASDEIVRLITGQSGIAATRVVYARRGELLVVDSDGENVQRVATGEYFYSPVWSPDGRKIAYGLRAPSGKVELHERDLSSGRSRVISARPEMSYAASYAPDGKKLAFTVSVGFVATEVDEYDLERSCCIKRLSRGPRNDLNPTYSPDGRFIAFNSDRLGQLHVYIMPAGGGEATLLSPYNFGERGHFAAPDWSPNGDDITFTGQSRGGFQIMLAKASRPGIATQITSSGSNEDPSWAPDGRHIVYSGVGRDGSGLYVIDAQTGSIRRLVSGSKLQMADWSPVLLRVGGQATAN